MSKKQFELQRKRLLAQIKGQEKRLTKEKTKFKQKGQITLLKKRLSNVRKARVNVAKARFQSSGVAKAAKKVSKVGKSAASKAIAYEKAHGKAQVKALKRFFKKF